MSQSIQYTELVELVKANSLSATLAKKVINYYDQCDKLIMVYVCNRIGRTDSVYEIPEKVVLQRIERKSGDIYHSIGHLNHHQTYKTDKGKWEYFAHSTENNKVYHIPNKIFSDADWYSLVKHEHLDELMKNGTVYFENEYIGGLCEQVKSARYTLYDRKDIIKMLKTIE